MLGLDNQATRDAMLSELTEKAKDLVERLEQGDIEGATDALKQVDEARGRNLYLQVGQLTRGLHSAIRNFQIDTSQVGDANESEMANATDRLSYVISLTQKSADRTMDMVEEGVPLATSLGEEAGTLRAEWSRLINREMEADEFRQLCQRMDKFLVDTEANSQDLTEKFNNILLAQDFQDLTGQVIKKVMELVRDVEGNLVDLMRVAGQVEELTGIVNHKETNEAVEHDPTCPEGPQINAEKRQDVVSSQDDVDDLLSSLGF